MRKKLKSIVMIFASILLCGSNMLSTITIKANVTKLEDTGYWHSGQAHNPDNPAYTAWFDHQKIEKIHVEQGIGVCSEPWEVINGWSGLYGLHRHKNGIYQIYGTMRMSTPINPIGIMQLAS